MAYGFEKCTSVCVCPMCPLDEIHVRHMLVPIVEGTGFSLLPVWCYTFSFCPITDDVCHFDHLTKVIPVGKK